MTEFDRPRWQVHLGQLPFGPVELTIETQPDGEGGTLLNHTVEITVIPRFRPLGWVLERLVLIRIFRSDMEQSLAAFVDLVHKEETGK